MNGLTDTSEIFEEIVKHAVTHLTLAGTHLHKKSLSNEPHRHEFFDHWPVASTHKFLYLGICLHFINIYMDFYCAKVT